MLPSHHTDEEAEALSGRRAVPDSPPRVLESHWFVWITQMNHIPKAIGHDKPRAWAGSLVRGRGAGPIPGGGGGAT